MQISRSLFTATLLALLSGFSLAAYAADGAIKVTSVAEVEVATVGPDGKKTLRRATPEKAVPGTEVFYTNTFENVGRQAASDIVINNPIPNDTAYKAGSAFGKDAVVVFSADGGKTFDVADKVQVKGTDGRQRAALPSEYTNIRWIYKGQLQPGKSSAVGFHAVIK